MKRILITFLLLVAVYYVFLPSSARAADSPVPPPPPPEYTCSSGVCCFVAYGCIVATGNYTTTACTSGYTSPAGSDAASDCYISGCAAQTVSGYAVPALNNGASTSVTKSACYRTVGGYYGATATCNTGTVTISNEAALVCTSGYHYTFGTWYQTTYGCYDVCVLATCAAGSVSGYDYPLLDHYETTTDSKAITSGSITATLQCHDGVVTVQSETYSCSPGYYLSGTSCLTCPADSYCTGGTAQPVACAIHMSSSAGASSCFCDSLYNSTTHYATEYFNCDASLSNGCEVSRTYDGILPCTDEIACGTCGDGLCNFFSCNPETETTCRADCGYCGDGYCTVELGEDVYNCHSDCGGIECYDTEDIEQICYYYCYYDAGYSNGYCSGVNAYCSGGYSCQSDYSETQCNYCGGLYQFYSSGSCYCY